MMTKKILAILFGADVLVVILHLFFGKEDIFFNLDGEKNLPAGYSALKLLVVAGVSWTTFFLLRKEKSGKPKRGDFSWVFFGIPFFYLGLDEFFTLHEQAIAFLSPPFLLGLGWFSNPVFYWVILFSPLIISVLVFFGFFIKNLPEKFFLSRRFFFAGTFSFFLVIVCEFWGGFLAGEVGYLMMTLEESFEIFGASFFLAGVLFCQQLERKKRII